MKDSRERFSDRVENYIRFRPGYPGTLVSTLLSESAASDMPRVADVGSGTGIFSRLLLDRGVAVYGIEPNTNMRKAAEEYLAAYDKFVSIDGSAESTGLADDSVELVTAAQAFHWFNNEATKSEFRRILKTGGRLALIWNRRNLEQRFQHAYDVLLREFAPEYGQVNHMNLDEETLAGFFQPGEMQLLHFDNRQRLDFDSLVGRLQSSSYCPKQDSAEYSALLAELQRLFAKHASGDRVDFEYDTRLYLGPIAR